MPIGKWHPDLSKTGRIIDIGYFYWAQKSSTSSTDFDDSYSSRQISVPIAKWQLDFADIFEIIIFLEYP